MPDFWDVSMEAAAGTGATPGTAAIILGPALDFAKKHNPDSVRPTLSQMQLMLTYVAAGKYDEYAKIYGAPGFKIDVGNLDPEFKRHFKTLRNLANACDSQMTDQTSNYTDIQREGLRYCSKHYSDIEVAMRKKIAAGDAIGLADALASHGLHFFHLREPNEAFADLEEAIRIFKAARLGQRAVESADMAFSLGAKEPKVQGSQRASASSEAADSFMISNDEPYIPFIVVKRAIEQADDAIAKKNQKEAESALDLATRWAEASIKIHSFMRSTWPCHSSVALMHLLNGQIRQAQLKYAKAFPDNAKGQGSTQLNSAAAEYKRAFVISVYSNGPTSRQSRNAGEWYSNLVNTTGRDEDVKSMTSFMEKLSIMPDVGMSWPADWENIIDCPSKSR